MSFRARRFETQRLRPWLVAAALGLAGAACGSNTTTPDAPTTTEVFDGSLKATGSDFHDFTVAQQGNVTATLTSLSPQTTITVGLGIGNPTATGCSLLEWTDSAAVGGGIQGSIVPGAYCLMIYDIGNVVSSDDYSISVTHP